MKRLILLIPAFLFGLILSAQMTGSFDLSIDFDEADYDFTRTLYFYVPSDYDENQAYPLVVGYRGGPHSNAGQFRDQLTFLADSIGAIILCPENEEHFWEQEGLTKQLFQYSVDEAQSIYNIDPDYIYLTGLSYGGRHAVIVSMDTDDGPIPNLRGVIPFAAGSDSQLQPNYADITDFPPACICIGLSDSNNFITVSNTLHNDIQANAGISILNEIPGVGHTVDFPTFPEEMMECINFIESQYPTTSLEYHPDFSAADINLFPNPAASNMTITFPENLKPNKLEIYSSFGLRIKQLPSDKKLNISELANGTYTLMIHSPKGIITKLFVVLR